jgi:nucleoid-associated protein YgaU
MMHKDLKIGMGVGLLLVVIATFWLATRPSLSTKARLLNSQNTDQQQNPADRLIPQTGVSGNVSTNVTQTQPQTIAEPNNTPPAETQKQKTKSPRFHIVIAGETLSAISSKYYGTAGKWQKILDANRDTIKSPNRLTPGTKLIIPPE